MRPKSKVYDIAELIAQKQMSIFSKFLIEAGWELADRPEPECYCLIAIGSSNCWAGPMYFECGVDERDGRLDGVAITAYIGWLERAKAQALKMLVELEDE